MLLLKKIKYDICSNHDEQDFLGNIMLHLTHNKMKYGKF
jgi:hypothetical protein